MPANLGSTAASLRLGSTQPYALRLGSTHIWSPPLEVSGLHSWYDFSDSGTMTLASGKISQITDKSGNGRHLTQGTDAARPTLTANAQNGKSGATFAGSQWLQAATAADWKFLHYGTDHSMLFVVTKTDGTGIQDNYEVLGTGQPGGGAGALGVSLIWYGGDTLVESATHTPNGTANYANTMPDPLFGGTHAYCVISHPAASSGDDRLALAWQGDQDAADDSTSYDQSPANADPGSPMTLGRAGAGGGYAALLSGRIYDVLVYRRSTAFTSAERAKVFAYLVSKWGLT